MKSARFSLLDTADEGDADFAVLDGFADEEVAPLDVFASKPQRVPDPVHLSRKKQESRGPARLNARVGPAWSLAGASGLSSQDRVLFVQKS